jgi:hypothetical protein
MIDGEGSVRAKRYARNIRIYNTDEGIVRACLDACNVLGLTAHARVREHAAPASTRPTWTVAIYGRENLERARDVLILRCEQKRAALDAAITSYSRRRAVCREELQRLIDDGFTHREMAPALGFKSHSTVQYHLGRFGLAAGRQSPSPCRCRACRLGPEGFQAMLDDGMTLGGIAVALGYKSQSSITYHLRRLGVAYARPRGRRPASPGAKRPASGKMG